MSRRLWARRERPRVQHGDTKVVCGELPAVSRGVEMSEETLILRIMLAQSLVDYELSPDYDREFAETYLRLKRGKAFEKEKHKCQ